MFFEIEVEEGVYIYILKVGDKKKILDFLERNVKYYCLEKLK